MKSTIRARVAIRFVSVLTVSPARGAGTAHDRLQSR